MTNNEKLAEIRKRVEKATKGPWVSTNEPNDSCCWSFHVETKERDQEPGMSECAAKGIADVSEESDAAFIAHSRSDIEYLLEKLDAAERLAEAIAEDQRSTGPFKPSKNTLSALAAFRTPARKGVGA